MEEHGVGLDSKWGANEGANSHAAEDDKADKKVKVTKADRGGASSASSGGTAISSSARDQWDGGLVLSLVSKVYKPMKELWGMYNGLDAVVPRGVCINLRTPEELVPRLLQQYKRKAKNEHYFPVVDVHLGRTHNRTFVQAEVDNAKRDPTVALALTMLPPKLGTLSFGYYYNMPVDLEQVIVDKVVFGYRFDSEVKLPPAAREVEFGNHFDKKVTLPSGLKTLRFGAFFCQPLHLPPGLKVLEFHPESKFDQPLSLPTSIREVTLGYRSSRPLKLPAGVKKLKLGSYFNRPFVIPVSVSKLELGDLFNHPLDLPDSLEELRLGHYYDQPLRLPPHLRQLSLGHYFSQPLELPDGLEVLHFSATSYFNYALELPEGLVEVEFGRDFNQRVRFPKSLTLARLNDSHNRPVELPEGEEDQWRIDVEGYWKWYKRVRK